MTNAGIKRYITPRLHDLIKEHVFPEYLDYQDKLPCAICDIFALICAVIKIQIQANGLP